MTSSAQLALAYIAKNPAAAGGVLSSMSLDASAAFIEEIPVAHAVILVANLQPAIAAKIFRNVDDKATAAIFRDLDFSSASAVVRQMDRASRRQFLSRLSKRTRVALEKSLSFPPETAGAHMTTEIPTLSETDSASAALDIIRQSDRDPIDIVFVLNDAGNLVGVVTSAVALRHPATTRLSVIVETACTQISAFSKLEAIADLAHWDDFAHLPVVNRQHQVIGAISRKALRPGRSGHAPGPTAGSQSIPASMFEALATTSSGLLNLASNAVTGAGQRGERNGR